MLAQTFALVFLLASASTYLAFFRYQLHTEVSLTVAVGAWTVLLIEAGNVQVASGGEVLTFGGLPLRALALFLAIVCGFALVAAILGEFPTDSMTQNNERT